MRLAELKPRFPDIEFEFYAIVRDIYYDTDGHDSTSGGYESPEKAFEVAQTTANSHGFRYISYWVEARSPTGDIRIDIDGLTGWTYDP